MTRTLDVAVIGAGASGALTAVHYARIAGEGCSGALIEAGARAARGLAYGTPYGAHLLNVPAAKMSALPEEPDHFLRWLRQQGIDAEAGTFAPRAVYGDYLASLLELPEVAARLTRVGGTAVGVTRSDDEWHVHLHDERVISARSVVLALGNLPPADPLRLGGDAPIAYVRDPWAAGASQGLDADAPVLLIGTGLTAIDVAIALRQQGHRGTVYALSRHGRLPHAHAPHLPQPLESIPDELATARGALRWVRRRIAEGADWRAVIDSLRPFTAKIWSAWPIEQRAAFLRHLRSVWDVHRHRAAPQIRSQMEVAVLSGKIVRMTSTGEGLRVEWRPRGETATRTVDVARVFNCTGPASDYSRVELPLVVQMRRAGWLVPDPLALGVETGEGGVLLGADGQPVDGLYTLGPLRRPALWESTAIPEIRTQAAELARLLSERGRSARMRVRS